MGEYQYYEFVAVDGPIADYPHIEPSAGETLTCVEFAGKALAVREARLESEAKAAAAEKRRAAEARKRHLRRRHEAVGRYLGRFGAPDGGEDRVGL